MTTELKKIKKDSYNIEKYVILPPVDVYETENEYVIKADMPGVKKENLQITIEQNQLEINGKIENGTAKEEEIKYSEYNLYDYHRVFTVGNSINRDGIGANLENGVLTLMLPKSEDIKPKKIEIKVEK